MVLSRDLARFGPFGEAEIWSHDSLPNLICKNLGKSDLGHVGRRFMGGWVSGYVWYLELSREPKHVAQQMRYQNVDLSNGYCLGIIIYFLN